MAARLSQEEMTNALIGAKEDLVQTFKKFEEEQDHFELSYALADLAKVPEHIPKVAICLRTVDPFPNEMSRVSRFVHNTLVYISRNTRGDAESFAKMVTAFEPSDIKPLASIRYITLHRDDAVKVVESVMDKSPKPIIGDLPRWQADHLFDQNSYYYFDFKAVREQVFRYLASFATEDALKNALSIVKANEHYKVDSHVYCCKSQDSFPQDLYNKLNALLELVKDRNGRINEALTFLPKVLADMVADYLPPNTD